eukprot:SM000022S07249  [mRNA]  locus=s22:785702:789683:+ [translate_table: standard]
MQKIKQVIHHLEGKDDSGGQGQQQQGKTYQRDPAAPYSGAPVHGKAIVGYGSSGEPLYEGDAGAAAVTRDPTMAAYGSQGQAPASTTADALSKMSLAGTGGAAGTAAGSAPVQHAPDIQPSGVAPTAPTAATDAAFVDNEFPWQRPPPQQLLPKHTPSSPTGTGGYATSTGAGAGADAGTGSGLSGVTGAAAQQSSSGSSPYSTTTGSSQYNSSSAARSGPGAGTAAAAGAAGLGAAALANRGADHTHIVDTGLGEGTDPAYGTKGGIGSRGAGPILGAATTGSYGGQSTPAAGYAGYDSTGTAAPTGSASGYSNQAGYDSGKPGDGVVRRTAETLGAAGVGAAGLEALRAHEQRKDGVGSGYGAGSQPGYGSTTYGSGTGVGAGLTGGYGTQASTDPNFKAGDHGITRAAEALGAAGVGAAGLEAFREHERNRASTAGGTGTLFQGPNKVPAGILSPTGGTDAGSQSGYDSSQTGTGHGSRTPGSDYSGAGYGSQTGTGAGGGYGSQSQYGTASNQSTGSSVGQMAHNALAGVGAGAGALAGAAVGGVAGLTGRSGQSGGQYDSSQVGSEYSGGQYDSSQTGSGYGGQTSSGLYGSDRSGSGYDNTQTGSAYGSTQTGTGTGSGYGSGHGSQSGYGTASNQSTGSSVGQMAHNALAGAGAGVGAIAGAATGGIASLTGRSGQSGGQYDSSQTASGYGGQYGGNRSGSGYDKSQTDSTYGQTGTGTGGGYGGQSDYSSQTGGLYGGSSGGGPYGGSDYGSQGAYNSGTAGGQSVGTTIGQMAKGALAGTAAGAGALAGVAAGGIASMTGGRRDSSQYQTGSVHDDSQSGPYSAGGTGDQYYTSDMQRSSNYGGSQPSSGYDQSGSGYNRSGDQTIGEGLPQGVARVAAAAGAAAGVHAVRRTGIAGQTTGQYDGQDQGYGGSSYPQTGSIGSQYSGTSGSMTQQERGEKNRELKSAYVGGPAVTRFMESAGLGQYSSLLTEAWVDMAELRSLSDDELITMGLPMGAVAKLKRALIRYTGY